MGSRAVHAMLSVEYAGTVVSKSVTIAADGNTDAVTVNRAIEYLTKRIQVMVQSEQGL